MPKQKPMKWVLPNVVHPPDTICFQINVPNERQYLAAFYGAIFLLSKPYAWGDDPSHTALEVGAVWRAIFDNLIAGNCTVCPTPQPGGLIEDFEMPLRVDCDCNVFVTCCDGTEKQILTAQQVKDLLQGQPSTGSPQPPPGGGCVTYHGVMGANGAWYVPTVVNTGDTLEFLRADGVTNDGGNIAWRAPDGGLFFAGANTGVTTTVGSDPLPAVPHLKVIANIDGTFYDVYPGPFTVPSVPLNSQVTLQVNDDPISNDSGTITFDLKVCNNQAGSWTSTLDFTTSPYASFVGGAFASWAVGSGYQGVTNGGVPNWAQLDITLDSCTITSVTMIYDALTPGGSSDVVFFEIDGGGYGTPGATAAGNPETYVVTSTTSLTSLLQAICSTGTTGGVDHIQKLIITGTGTKPSQLP